MNAVVANFATTASDGKVYQVAYYNMDMVLSVGYRVKSPKGIQFRRWENAVLKEYMLKGYSVNHRLDYIEDRIDRRIKDVETRLDEHEKRIDFFVRTSLPPVEGIFYDGQIFDAYVFVTNLIKSGRDPFQACHGDFEAGSCQTQCPISSDSSDRYEKHPRPFSDCG